MKIILFVIFACLSFASTLTNALVTIAICTRWDATGHMIDCELPKTATIGEGFGGVTIDDGAGHLLDVGLKTNYLGSLPAGWTESGGVQTPPSTAGVPATHLEIAYAIPSGSATASGATLADVCSSIASGRTAAYAPSPSFAVATTTPTCKVNGFTEPGHSLAGQTDYGTGTVVSTCPAGYTNVSGTCTLSNASLVKKPSDGKCGVVRVGNTITNDSRDPDCTGAGSAATALSATAAAGVLTAAAGGQTLRVDIDSGTGNVTITQSAPSASGTDTEVNKVALTGTGAGVGTVTGTSQTTTQGTGTLNDAGTVKNTDTINEAGTPSAGDFQNAGKDALAAVTPSSLGASAFSGTPHALPGGMPTLDGSAGCVNPPSIHIFGVDVVMDICALWAPLKSWFAWFLYAATALYIWRRMMRVVGA